MPATNENKGSMLQSLLRLLSQFWVKPNKNTPMPLEVDHGEKLPFFRLHSTGGFTLLESLLAISIAGLLAVVAIPRDNDLKSPMTLDAAARKLTSDIRYAQNMAATTGDTYGFRVTGATTYEIYNVGTGVVAPSPFTSQPMQENFGSNFGNTQFFTTYTVQFDDDGKPVTGGGTVIRLTDGSNSKYLEVTPTSGLVRTL